MGSWTKIAGFLRHPATTAQDSVRLVSKPSSGVSRLSILTYSIIAVGYFALIAYLRYAGVTGTTQSYLYLEVGGTLISFCYAANALVRFRGTHDRTALILAFGFVLSGIIETVGYFALNTRLQAGHALPTTVPMGWMVSRVLLAVMLLAAIAVDRYMPMARQPSRETAGALLVVLLAAYLTSAAFLAAPAAPFAHAAWILSRPWDLLPGGLFLVAAVWYRQQLNSGSGDKREAPSLYEYSLYGCASLNVLCHAAAIFSRHLFDGPFLLAELCKTASYVMILAGALLEQARLFEQVRSMAVSEPLTGLANYRRLIHVIETELDRSRRTQRGFSVILLDMDGLKAINDQFGHLTGSRALVRLGKGSFESFASDRYAGAVWGRRVRAGAAGSWARSCDAGGCACARKAVGRARATCAVGERGSGFVSRGWGFAGRVAGRGGPRALRHEAPRQGQYPKSQTNRGVPVRMTTTMPLKKLFPFHRNERRILMEIPVVLDRHEGAQGTESTFTENVSARGARVVTTRRWEKGEPLTFALRTGEFRSLARVAYCQPLHGDGYAVGVEFLDPAGRWVVQSKGSSAQRQGG